MLAGFFFIPAYYVNFERLCGEAEQALEQMQQEQASKTTEVSEFQSIGDDTTLAAAKTKAKAACLSHSCLSILWNLRRH